MSSQIRIKRHTESYEIVYPDGRPSTFFYYEDEPTRRHFMDRMTRKQAEQAAKTFAGGQRSKAPTA